MNALSPTSAALAILSGVALMAASAPQRALSLNVDQTPERVGVELVAHSPVTQRVDYSIELTGASRSRHSGSTTLVAGERHVLSTLRTGIGAEWCARAEVQEETGESYVLTAGECDA